MRVAVFGYDGFMGKAVVGQLREMGHEIIEAADDQGKFIDLLDESAIEAFIRQTKPEVVVNCAGIVANTEAAQMNPKFTTNLLNAVVKSGVPVARVIISGSAAEYGQTEADDVPVKETAPLKPTSLYGASKKDETTAALAIGAEHGLQVVVARIFNPIGAGMHPRMLIPNLLSQVAEIKAGKRDVIELSRLDALRDYIDVRDVARAIATLATSKPKQDVYNIGSGKSTANADLIDLILANNHITTKPEIHETSAQPEPLAAYQADVSRLKEEFGWEPTYSLEETVRDIANHAE